MLHYILRETERFGAGELAQMAVEGGCLWISYDASGKDDAAVRDALVPDVTDMCRDAGVILTVDDRPTLARELGLHGVRLSADFFCNNHGATPASMREELGPEAIIGIETADPTTVPAMIAADIDFVTLPASFSAEKRKDFVAHLRNSGLQMPVVAAGEFTPAQCREVIAEGCNAVAIGKAISDAPDPVVAMRATLQTLAE